MSTTINDSTYKRLKIVELRKKGYTIRKIQNELGLNSPSLVHYYIKKHDEITSKETVIFEALGEVSAIFMSQDIKGTQMIMPTEKLNEIGQRLLYLIG